MMRSIDSVYLNGAWIGVGGNTPFQDFPSKRFIKSIKISEIDPRNFNGADSACIYITLEDDYVVEMKTKDYLIGYQTFVDENS